MFQHYSSISLIVKNVINISSSPSSLLGILLLFPQHKILILRTKYSPEFYMLYIAMWLLYNDHIPFLMTCHIMPYFHSYGMISSSHIFLIDVHKWPSWALFLLLYNRFCRDLITSSCFSVFQFTYCHLYIYITWWFTICFCSLYAHCTLFSNVIVCSILQFISKWFS